MSLFNMERFNPRNIFHSLKSKKSISTISAALFSLFISSQWLKAEEVSTHTFTNNSWIEILNKWISLWSVFLKDNAKDKWVNIRDINNLDKVIHWLTSENVKNAFIPENPRFFKKNIKWIEYDFVEIDLVVSWWVVKWAAAIEYLSLNIPMSVSNNSTSVVIDRPNPEVFPSNNTGKTNNPKLEQKVVMWSSVAVIPQRSLTLWKWKDLDFKSIREKVETASSERVSQTLILAKKLWIVHIKDLETALNWVLDLYDQKLVKIIETLSKSNSNLDEDVIISALIKSLDQDYKFYLEIYKTIEFAINKYTEWLWTDIKTDLTNSFLASTISWNRSNFAQFINAWLWESKKLFNYDSDANDYAKSILQILESKTNPIRLEQWLKSLESKYHSELNNLLSWAISDKEVELAQRNLTIKFWTIKSRLIKSLSNWTYDQVLAEMLKWKWISKKIKWWLNLDLVSEILSSEFKDIVWLYSDRLESYKVQQQKQQLLAMELVKSNKFRETNQSNIRIYLDVFVMPVFSNMDQNQISSAQDKLDNLLNLILSSNANIYEILREFRTQNIYVDVSEKANLSDSVKDVLKAYAYKLKSSLVVDYENQVYSDQSFNHPIDFKSVKLVVDNTMKIAKIYLDNNNPSELAILETIKSDLTKYVWLASRSKDPAKFLSLVAFKYEYMIKWAVPKTKNLNSEYVRNLDQLATLIRIYHSREYISWLSYEDYSSFVSRNWEKKIVFALWTSHIQKTSFNKEIPFQEIKSKFDTAFDDLTQSQKSNLISFFSDSRNIKEAKENALEYLFSLSIPESTLQQFVVNSSWSSAQWILQQIKAYRKQHLSNPWNITSSAKATLKALHDWFYEDWQLSRYSKRTFEERFKLAILAHNHWFGWVKVLLAKYNDNIIKAFHNDSYGKQVEKAKSQFGFHQFISLLKPDLGEVSNTKKVVWL